MLKPGGRVAISEGEHAAAPEDARWYPLVRLRGRRGAGARCPDLAACSRLSGRAGDGETGKPRTGRRLGTGPRLRRLVSSAIIEARKPMGSGRMLHDQLLHLTRGSPAGAGPPRMTLAALMKLAGLMKPAGLIPGRENTDVRTTWHAPSVSWPAKAGHPRTHMRYPPSSGILPLLPNSLSILPRPYPVVIAARVCVKDMSAACLGGGAGVKSRSPRKRVREAQDLRPAPPPKHNRACRSAAIGPAPACEVCSVRRPGPRPSSCVMWRRATSTHIRSPFAAAAPGTPIHGAASWAIGTIL